MEIHKEVHRVRAGSATRTRSDLHSSESYMDGVETKSQFDRKEITLNLSLSMDSYPFFRAGRLVHPISVPVGYSFQRVSDPAAYINPRSTCAIKE